MTLAEGPGALPEAETAIPWCKVRLDLARPSVALGEWLEGAVTLHGARTKQLVRHVDLTAAYVVRLRRQGVTYSPGYEAIDIEYEPAAGFWLRADEVRRVPFRIRAPEQSPLPAALLVGGSVTLPVPWGLLLGTTGLRPVQAILLPPRQFQAVSALLAELSGSSVWRCWRSGRRDGIRAAFAPSRADAAFWGIELQLFPGGECCYGQVEITPRARSLGHALFSVHRERQVFSVRFHADDLEAARQQFQSILERVCRPKTPAGALPIPDVAPVSPDRFPRPAAAPALDPRERPVPALDPRERPVPAEEERT